MAPGNGPLETPILSFPSPSAQETPGSDQPKALPSGRGKGHHTPPQSHLTTPFTPPTQSSTTSQAALLSITGSRAGQLSYAIFYTVLHE